MSSANTGVPAVTDDITGRPHPTSLWLCADWEAGVLHGLNVPVSGASQHPPQASIPADDHPSLNAAPSHTGNWRISPTSDRWGSSKCRTENRLRDILDRCTVATDLPSEAETYRRRLAEIVWWSYGTLIDQGADICHFQLSTEYLHPVLLKPYSDKLWDTAVALCASEETTEEPASITVAARTITSAVQAARIPHLSNREEDLHSRAGALIAEQYIATGRSVTLPGL